MTTGFDMAKTGAASAAPHPFLEPHRTRFDRCLKSERLGFLGTARVMLDVEDELRARGAEDKPFKVVRSWYAPDEFSDFDASMRWQVADKLLRFVPEATLVTARSRDARVFYAMARRAAHLSELDNYPPDRAAQIAFDEMRELTRDQAEARINPRPDGPAASMTRTTPTGKFEKPVVDRYEQAFQRDAGTAKETPTQAIETWSDIWQNCPESFTAAVRRWRDTGIRQDWPSEREFALVYMSEIGVSPIVTKALSTWLELGRDERRPDLLAHLIAEGVRAASATEDGP
jgi:hypothetical protein